MKKKSVSEQSFLTVYFCGKEKCQPGHYFGPAVRPHYLIHVILEGKRVFFQKSGVTYSLKKGDAFLIPPMESTYYQAARKIPGSMPGGGILTEKPVRKSCLRQFFLILLSIRIREAILRSPGFHETAAGILQRISRTSAGAFGKSSSASFLYAGSLSCKEPRFL